MAGLEVSTRAKAYIKSTEKSQVRKVPRPLGPKAMGPGRAQGPGPYGPRPLGPKGLGTFWTSLFSVDFV